MAIFKKGDNWYIDYYVKGKRKRKKVGPSKKLAEQVLSDIHLKIYKGEYLGIYEDKKITFDDYSQQYLEYSKTNKAYSTYMKCDRFNVARLMEVFSGFYLSEIMPHKIEKYKSTRLVSVSPAKVNRELACLKHMYSKAIEWGFVKNNPVKQVKFLKEPPGRLRYLQPDEAEALVAACPGYLKPIVITALNTGMRKSEILNLHWTQVDLKGKNITVKKAKNNESRVIPMNQTLYNELSRLLKEAKSEYVFTDDKGRHFGDIKKGFASAVKRVGIKDFRFHDLRHTFGSQLVMKNVSLKTIQELMGHKDIEMTMRYSHVSREYKQEAIERLDSIWTLYGHQEDGETLSKDTTH